MPEQIEMPVNCDRCGGVWDLNSTYSHPDYENVICPPCKRELDAADDEDDADV